MMTAASDPDISRRAVDLEGKDYGVVAPGYQMAASSASQLQGQLGAGSPGV